MGVMSALAKKFDTLGNGHQRTIDLSQRIQSTHANVNCSTVMLNLQLIHSPSVMSGTKTGMVSGVSFQVVSTTVSQTTVQPMVVIQSIMIAAVVPPSHSCGLQLVQDTTNVALIQLVALSKTTTINAKLKTA